MVNASGLPYPASWGAVTFCLAPTIRRVNLAVRELEVQHDARTVAGSDAEARAQRAAARDPAAWEELFELHYSSVFGFVRYRLRGADEAEDIAAQAFEVAYSRADRFDYRGLPFEAWIMGIARNLVRDHVKKAVRRGATDELDDFNSPAEPDRSGQVDLRNDLGAALRTLTEDQQEVITLRFLLDKSVTETAILMDRSEDAVKNLQRRALAAMQRALAQASYPRALRE